MAMKLAVFIVAVLCFSTLSFIHASSNGFTVDLIHHDSPKSPFYNPQETHFDRLRKAFLRSIARGASFKAATLGVSSDEIQSRIIPNAGEYLMSVSLGTPPVEILAIADTGSDVLWTQCKPCEHCYKQSAPLFNPEASSTYRDLSCSSRPCEDLRTVQCSSNGACEYSLQYGDQSYSNGNLASETLTIGSTSNRSIAFPKTIFGCGHDNEGTFNEGASGIVGLGGGPLSFITQLESQIKGTFSYCLLPFNSNSTSKLSFGSDGVVSGEGVVSTPIVDKEPSTFYYLTLEGISVGEKKLLYKSASSKTNAIGGGSEEGNIIIDSGTTLTLLPSEFYDELEASVKESINAEPIQSPISALNLCYQIQGDSFEPPLVTVHFTDADVVLKPQNTFVAVQEGVVCLALVPSTDLAIFGNIAQMDFLVGYDLQNKTVSFKATDCTNY